jgi:hypothetical protein
MIETDVYELFVTESEFCFVRFAALSSDRVISGRSVSMD